MWSVVGCGCVWVSLQSLQVCVGSVDACVDRAGVCMGSIVGVDVCGYMCPLMLISHVCGCC